MGDQAGELVLEGIHCGYAISWPRRNRALVIISGSDIGEFGDAPMVNLESRMDGVVPVELFIDARHVKGASVEVSRDWAQWLSANRSRFSRIDMLTGSRYVEMTAETARRFAGLQDIMRVHTDAAVFDRELSAAR